MNSELSNTEFNELIRYFQGSNYKNAHTRKMYQRQNQKLLKHLNAMKLVDNKIEGYVSGVDVDIKYSIGSKGFTIQHTNLSVINTHKYLTEMKKEIMNRVAEGHQNHHRPPYAPGRYYLKRAKVKPITSSGRKAIQEGKVTERFVQQAADWGLEVITGKSKQKKHRS